jgi:hypothetical protein
LGECVEDGQQALLCLGLMGDFVAQGVCHALDQDAACFFLHACCCGYLSVLLVADRPSCFEGA